MPRASGITSGLETGIDRAFTWCRVPIIWAAAITLIGFVHDLRWFWYGAPVSLLGELLQVWSASQLMKDEQLAVSGPYSYVRNPMYIGRFFLGLGIFIMTWNPYLVAGYTVVFAVYASRRVSGEEKRLHAVFGDSYAEYCSEIRRWLPKLRSYSKAQSRNASWSQVRKNHEHLNLLILLIVLAAIYLRIDRFSDIYWRL